MLLLSALLALSAANITSYAESYAMITDDAVTAKVLKIIDGDAIKVQLVGSGKVALVKLLGISAKGYNMALSYLTDKVLGANVTLNRDRNITTNQGNWNYMYVNCNGVTINDDIVMKGFAVVDKSQAEALRYRNISEAERTAVSNGSELWNKSSTVNDGDGTLRTGENYTGDTVNINTATADQLRTRLVGISNSIAEHIVEYRNKNPFNDITELKFVKGITADMFTYNRKIMCVYTNVNGANRAELETLGNMSSKDIEDIISFRRRDRFDKTKDLVTRGLMTDTKYNSISDFITVSDSWDDSDIAKPKTVVNINTATDAALKISFIGSSNAPVIQAQRVNGYTFKSIQELLYIPEFSLNEEDLNYVEDNVHVMTNINNTSDSELRSIFSKISPSRILKMDWINNLESISSILKNENVDNVKNLEDVFYTTYYRTNYVNLNTATIAQMVEAGVPSKDAQAILAARPINYPSQLPVDVSDYNGKVSLYTNINAASRSELQSLGLSDSLITEIGNFVNDQPIGSLAELKDIFSKNNASSIYNQIGKYIVVR